MSREIKRGDFVFFKNEASSNILRIGLVLGEIEEGFILCTEAFEDKENKHIVYEEDVILTKYIYTFNASARSFIQMF